MATWVIALTEQIQVKCWVWPSMTTTQSSLGDCERGSVGLGGH